MKTCPYCAESIQDAAIICKHCRKELTAAPAPVQAHQKPSSRIVTLIVYAVLAGAAVAALLAFWNTEPSKASSGPGTLAVRVGVSATELAVTNVSAPAGGELVVYVNGTPPFAYKATSTVPAVGTSVRLPLNSFVTNNGDRFNPLTKAVTVIWVGGGGYDYRSFDATR